MERGPSSAEWTDAWVFLNQSRGEDERRGCFG